MMSQRREKKHVRSSDDDCLAAVAAVAAAVVVVSDSEDSCASGIGSLSGSSCGGERPCMRRSSETEEASLDSPILRPYRHLSANDLNQCIGEEETEVSEQEDAEDDIDIDIDTDIDIDNNNNASCGGGEDDHPATIEGVSSVHYYNNPLSMRMAKSLADNAGPSHLFGAGTRYLNLTLPYPVRTPTYPNYNNNSNNNNNNNNKYGGCSDTDVDSDYGQFSDLSHHSNEAIMNEAINIALDTTSDAAAAAAAAAYLTTSSF